MTYAVVIQPRANAEAEEAYQWIAEQSPERAANWFNGLREAIDSLKTFPHRCSLARENDAFPEEVRHLLYGRRRGIYRIVFIIRGETVHIISIRHGAREPLGAEDVSDGGLE
jgi:plasmid stabilization system protein ParE